jgi:hypothetical protein
MKKVLFFHMAAIAAFAALAEVEAIHPDWSQVAEDSKSKNVTIPKGEVWVAFREDQENLNAVVQHKLLINGTLVLDGIEEYKGVGKSSGTIIKRGERTLQLITGNAAFTGNVYIEEGTLWQKNWYLTDGASQSHIYISDGATYRTEKGLGDVTVHVSGSGVGNQGAFIIDGSELAGVSKLVVEGSARIVVNVSGNIISSKDNGSNATARKVHIPAQVILNGNELSIGGNAQYNGFYNTEFIGGGKVVFESG